MPLFGTEGERIGYEVHDGPAGAPPLVLIHGFTASSASFISNLPGLTERFTVIAVELLGHGSSDAPETIDAYGPDAAVARLAALFDHLGLERPLVCGHSLGGALALRFALDRPQALSGLVIINSNSAAGSPEWRENARASMTQLAAKVRAEGAAFMRTTRLYPAQSKRLPPDARRMLTEDFERLQPAGIAGTAEGLTIAVNSFERLGDLTTPTLVVIGDRDLDFVQNAPRFLVRMPSDLVETFTIEGGGHAANLEQPALFNEALFAFAERLGYLDDGSEPIVETAAPVAFVLANELSDPDGDALGYVDDDGEPPVRTAEPTAVAPISEPGAVNDPDGDALGPTLYEGALTSLRGRGRQTVLTAAGSGLIIVGAALLVAAFFVGGDGDNDGRAAAGLDATSTLTPIEQSAGVRTSATASPTRTGIATQAATQLATVVATQAVTVTTPASTPTPRVVATPTDEPAATPTLVATPTPTATPTATASPTPSGPAVSITGPSSGQPGATFTFAVAESPDAITRNWSASNGASAAHTSAFSVTFAAGCHSVSVTSIFPGGITRSATRVVAVGVNSCG